VFATSFYLARSTDRCIPVTEAGEGGEGKLRVSIVCGRRNVQNEGCSDWQMRCKEEDAKDVNQGGLETSKEHVRRLFNVTCKEICSVLRSCLKLQSVWRLAIPFGRELRSAPFCFVKLCCPSTCDHQNRPTPKKNQNHPLGSSLRQAIIKHRVFLTKSDQESRYNFPTLIGARIITTALTPPMRRSGSGIWPHLLCTLPRD